MITLRSLGLHEVTTLSNFFIDRYMPKANGEFVKVYIYLLRMLENTKTPFGLAQMADSLFCTEGDILRALKYWENEGLLSVLYKEEQLAGITLLAPWMNQEPSSDASDIRNGRSISSAQSQFGTATGTISGTISDTTSGAISDTTLDAMTDTAAAQPSAQYVATGNYVSVANIPDSSPDTIASGLPDTAATRDSNATNPSPERKSLTLDRIKELKQNEDIVQLLYIAEQYLGKTLTPTETRKILFFYDELHMSVDLIDYLIEYCVGRDHRSIRYIETVAMAWKEEGITTVEMAKDSTARYSRDYFTVLKAMGITNRSPIDTEVAMINTWTKEYGFTMDLIQEACSRTVIQTGQPSFQYADKILQSWKKKSIRTLEDVRLQDAQHQKRKLEKAASKPVQPQTTNRFNNFHQRDYDFAEYEKKLLNH